MLGLKKMAEIHHIFSKLYDRKLLKTLLILNNLFASDVYFKNFLTIWVLAGSKKYYLPSKRLFIKNIVNEKSLT